MFCVSLLRFWSCLAFVNDWQTFHSREKTLTFFKTVFISLYVRKLVIQTISLCHCVYYMVELFSSLSFLSVFKFKWNASRNIIICVLPIFHILWPIFMLGCLYSRSSVHTKSPHISSHLHILVLYMQYPFYSYQYPYYYFHWI